MLPSSLRAVVLTLSIWPVGGMSNAAHAFIRPGGMAQQVPSTLVGTWHGTFSSKNYQSFPVTIVVHQQTNGVRGAATVGGPCIGGADLLVTANGTNVVLAGSDPKGDNITFRGTIDSSGTQLTLTYILNGSASGRCETDQGAGTLDKQ